MAATITSTAGFSDSEAGALALVVTELGQNLVKYAQAGQLVFRLLDENGTKGLEVMSLDSGPGMRDIPQSLSDGYSSSGTMGAGLGAVKRISTSFQIYSLPNVGTGIVARVLAPHNAPIRNHQSLDIGVINVAMPGQDVCGDSWFVSQNAKRAVLMVVDGLGHGPFAEEAANEAVKSIKEDCSLGVTEMLSKVHNSLRSTRGAVLAAATVDLEKGDVKYAGIGNITASISGATTSQHLVSMNGTAGLAASIKPFDYEWPRTGILIMSSDGLANHWKLGTYPGLNNADTSLIAGILYQNYYRGRDDVTVLVARWSQI
jgi:anti-sigma regulatory factor (Ser/Thr protein kinase)